MATTLYAATADVAEQRYTLDLALAGRRLMLALTPAPSAKRGVHASLHGGQGGGLAVLVRARHPRLAGGRRGYALRVELGPPAHS